MKLVAPGGLEPVTLPVPAAFMTRSFHRLPTMVTVDRVSHDGQVGLASILSNCKTSRVSPAMSPGLIVLFLILCPC